MLRITPGLHAALRRAAARQGLSLNDYCARKLVAPMAGLLSQSAPIAAVQRAAELLGERLIGVVAYGSWARGEAADGSDVDLLVVVDPGVRLTRQLYRRWDDAPVEWGGRVVDPHFVHLPPAGETVAGMWGEAAVDGIVLFEIDLRLSARLIQVRHDIVEGRIVRRLSHGQTYWVTREAA